MCFLLSRVVCISFCSEKENFLSGSLDRTVLLWDQRAEKSQVKLMILYTIMLLEINSCFTTCLCQLSKLAL
jgi:WD40 repeat protein